MSYDAASVIGYAFALLLASIAFALFVSMALAAWFCIVAYREGRR